MQENKKYKVVIDPYAVSKLNSHAVFLAQVSEDAANRLIDSFYQSAKSLEDFPQRNPFIPELDITGVGYRKLLFEKRYLLVYTVGDDHVYVDDIVDCREDYNWLL